MAARNKHNPQLVAPAGTTSQRTSGSLIARSLMVVALIASALFAAAFVTAQENTPEASSTPDGTPAATPSAEMPRLELELEELNDSGIEGTVTLFDAGERTIVEFDVEGAGGDHPANISAGVCGDLDPEPAHELEPIDENGESLTVVEVTLDELLESEHAIDVRLAPDQLGTLIACANIEGEPEVPVAGTPEATAEATPTGEGGQVATETPDVTVASTETPEATTEATVETAATTEAVTTPESSPTDGTGGTVNAGEPGATIPLRELNDSGVTGTVTLSSQGEATRISIQIEGDAVTGDHIAHLHSGTCEAPGEYTYTLNPVSEEGTSETVVNITLDELLTGGYMVNVHPSEANWDAWMVCGELVETTTATATVTPAATTEAGGQVTTPAETPTATTPATTTPSTTTPVIPVQTIPPAPTGDGTSGVTGVVTTDTSVQTLPQTAGVGAMLEWPSDPRTAILWATTGAAIILAAAALVIRRGERQTTTTPSRWTRLGI